MKRKEPSKHTMALRHSSVNAFKHRSDAHLPVLMTLDSPSFIKLCEANSTPSIELQKDLGVLSIFPAEIRDMIWKFHIEDGTIVVKGIRAQPLGRLPPILYVNNGISAEVDHLFFDKLVYFWASDGCRYQYADIPITPAAETIQRTLARNEMTSVLDGLSFLPQDVKDCVLGLVLIIGYLGAGMSVIKGHAEDLVWRDDFWYCEVLTGDELLMTQVPNHEPKFLSVRRDHRLRHGPQPPSNYVLCVAYEHLLGAQTKDHHVAENMIQAIGDMVHLVTREMGHIHQHRPLGRHMYFRPAGMTRREFWGE